MPSSTQSPIEFKLYIDEYLDSYIPDVVGAVGYGGPEVNIINTIMIFTIVIIIVVVFTVTTIVVFIFERFRYRKLLMMPSIWTPLFICQSSSSNALSPQ